jgi:phosphoribosyl-ATP pyrophosphohydrolase/phosphoribosyl-AMP cyclohydrolase/histidinol dehydrogenase
MSALLPVRTVAEVTAAGRTATDPDTLAGAARILADVRAGGEAALRRHAEALDGLSPGAPLVLGADALEAALADLPAADRGVLERARDRIAAFAAAQRASLRELEVPVPGGRAGHALAPVAAAGCYAPGGRYPLPSSVLMTAVTARAAGVARVVVASPRPRPVTLAAAALAGAEAVLCAGGAQAIAALVGGVAGLPACDAVVGPGNRWVTAAKQLVAGQVRIDMLAGPSELLVVADGTADPRWVAADLLAQAEHDPDAVPVLTTWDRGLPGRVATALERQLADLPTAAVARQALARGGVIPVDHPAGAAAVADALAPEHLQLAVADPRGLLARCEHWGAAFLGHGSAEVLGDYGAGPNHTLPTGGTARSSGGLWVGTFLRARTWLEVDPGAAEAGQLLDDTARLARLEGLEAHARAADVRQRPPQARA